MEPTGCRASPSRLSQRRKYNKYEHSEEKLVSTSEDKITLNLSNQQSGPGASERLHNAKEQKRIITMTHKTLGDKVKAALTEVKMPGRDDT